MRKPGRGEAAAKTAVASAGRAPAGEAEWQVVYRTLRHLAQRRAALDVEEAAWPRRARSAGVRRHLGYGSFTEYVERVLGYTPGAARERLRVADALTALPQLRAAMNAGDVAYSAARELTRVATAATEAAWLKAAANHTVRDIEAMVSGRHRGDLPTDAPDPAARLHEVRLLLTSATLALFHDSRRVREAACGHPLTDDDRVAEWFRRDRAGAATADPAADRPAHQVAVTTCDDCRTTARPTMVA